MAASETRSDNTGETEEPRGDEPARVTVWVRGEVQGVGFRWFTRAAALRVGGLVGFALNLGDGRVQIVAEGTRSRCDLLLEWLRSGDTPGSVEGVTEIWDAPRGGYRGFAIR
ncbi:acylphosphatase [Streptomyces iconiensis]|uniref:acylphosphatase n=1 Tax=Streptomyces iconiensis TaxID=1384038 RepID=A0ABT6ZVT0_9ACTN|nr:acylphosphatase [Streptomyces iconiensis]MDJ1132538.1 acylphosphatase [Streptomyces iconiensis]